jgi:NADH-quinone oxidoreductase subunit C
MEAARIYERLKDRFTDEILEVSDRKPDPFAVVAPAAIVRIGLFLYDDPECAMDCLSNETGVDYKDRIEVVYHLFSFKHRHSCVLKVKLPRENPSVETVEEIWRSANWMER